MQNELKISSFTESLVYILRPTSLVLVLLSYYCTATSTGLLYVKTCTNSSHCLFCVSKWCTALLMCLSLINSWVGSADLQRRKWVAIDGLEWSNKTATDALTHSLLCISFFSLALQGVGCRLTKTSLQELHVIVSLARTPYFAGYSGCSFYVCGSHVVIR